VHQGLPCLKQSLAVLSRKETLLLSQVGHCTSAVLQQALQQVRLRRVGLEQELLQLA